MLRLRRRHLAPALLGGTIGLALGTVRAGVGPAYLDSTARTLSQPLFERGLTAGSAAAGRVSDLVVHPPAADGAHWVTGRLHEPAGRSGPPRAVPFKFRAAVPYEPLLAVDRPDPAAFALPDYLRLLADRLPQAAPAYRYAWWEEPRWTVLLWAAGGTVLAGAGWPLAYRRVGGGDGSPDPWTQPVPPHAPGPPPAGPDSPPPEPAPAGDPDGELATYVRRLEASLASEILRPSPADPTVPDDLL